MECELATPQGETRNSQRPKTYLQPTLFIMITSLANDELEKILDSLNARDASNFEFALKSSKLVTINYEFHEYMKLRRNKSIVEIASEAVKHENHDILVHILTNFNYTSYTFRSKVAAIIMENNKFKNIKVIEETATRIKGKNTFLKTEFFHLIKNIANGLSSVTINSKICARNNVSFQDFENFLKINEPYTDTLIFFNNVFCNKLRNNQNCICDAVHFLNYCNFKKFKSMLMYSALNFLACILIHQTNVSTILNTILSTCKDANLEDFDKDNDKLACIILPHLVCEMHEKMHSIYLENICLANSNKKEDFILYTTKIVSVFHNFNNIVDKLSEFMNTSTSLFEQYATRRKQDALKYCFLFGGNCHNFNELTYYNTHYGGYGRSLPTPIANALLINIIKNGETKLSRQIMQEIGHKSTLHAEFFHYITTGKRKPILFVLNAICFNQSTNEEAVNYVIEAIKQKQNVTSGIIETILNTGNIKIIETLKYTSNNVDKYINNTTLENIAKNGPDADIIFEKAIFENSNKTNFFFNVPFQKHLNILLKYQNKLPKTFQKIKRFKLWTSKNITKNFEINIFLLMYKNKMPLTKPEFLEEIFKHCKRQCRTGFIESIKMGAFDDYKEQIFSVYQRLEETFQFDIVKIIQRRLTR